MSLPAQRSAIEAQPLIAVRNVRASSRWYRELLGADSLPEHPHRDLYERISCSEFDGWTECSRRSVAFSAGAPSSRYLVRIRFRFERDVSTVSPQQHFELPKPS